MLESSPPIGEEELNLPDQPLFTREERQLLVSWCSYLMWEESNPLKFENEKLLHCRIQAVYRKAVVAMLFYPEIWSVVDYKPPSSYSLKR